MGTEEKAQADQLAAAIVASFPPYLAARLAEIGVIPVGAMADAVTAGAERLASALHELLAAPPEDQANSPLELVREATQPVSEAMARMGVRPPARDVWEIEIHPEDRFELYPASSRDLGDEVWQLHIQWGIDKAKAVAGVVPSPPTTGAMRAPSVALFGVPIEGRMALTEAIKSCGYEALVWRNPAALAAAEALRPTLVVVDLRHPAAHDAIRSLAASGTRVVATAGRVDDLMMPGVLALGAEEVYDLDGLVDRLDRLLPRLV